MSRSPRRTESPGPAKGSSTRPATNGADRRFAVGSIEERIGPQSDSLEREAERVAASLVAGATAVGDRAWSVAASSMTVGDRRVGGAADEGTIRRMPADPAEEPKGMEPPMEAAHPRIVAGADPDEAPAAEPAHVLLVEDDADCIQGQMRKSVFMATLRAEVSATVEEAMSGTGWSAEACPYIDYWIGYYENRGSAQIEQALRRYAPEAAGATDAAGYIRIVTGRVRRSVEIWVKTGEVTGVPVEVPTTPSADNRAAGSAEGVLFKPKPGAIPPSSPVSVRDRLGAGEPLPGSLRSRMESAFATSFAGVRLHVDEGGARVSTDLNARALTVGRHMAFAQGEYRPGTVEGDALIAHELAHVVQQGHGEALSARPTATHEDHDHGLEEDADSSAVRVLTSLWGGIAQTPGRAAPRLTSGLSLQRCTTRSKGPIDQKRLAEAIGNFRDENDHLDKTKLAKIDAALGSATAGNLNLLIAYYDYYSNHSVTEELPTSSQNLAETKPNSGTKLRKDLLDPAFSTSTLGSTLIHEFVHTRHDTNVMGARDYQEGEAYGVEYVIAKRAGDTARMQTIAQVMNNPKQLAMPALFPALIKNFKIAFALMTVLYEVIDKVPSTVSIPALITPTALTVEEAREMVTQYISSQSRSKRLADLLTWIDANLGSFTFPI